MKELFVFNGKNIITAIIFTVSTYTNKVVMHMKNIIPSITKFILTIMFFYHINQIIIFFVDSVIPTPEEMKGAILIYLLIFIVEIALANFCTYLVFRVAKKDTVVR